MKKGIKKFLKPDWKKIAITILLFCFSLIVSSYTFQTKLKFISYIIFPSGLLENIWMFFAHPPVKAPHDIVLTPFDDIISILLFIFELLYLYLISSLIVFVYNKFKSKYKD